MAIDFQVVTKAVFGILKALGYVYKKPKPHAALSFERCGFGCVWASRRPAYAFTRFT